MQLAFLIVAIILFIAAAIPTAPLQPFTQHIIAAGLAFGFASFLVTII